MDLGAIDGGTGAITDLGRRMLAFPVHPRYARMLLAAQEFGCVRPVALIAALTQGRDLLVRQPGSRAEDAPSDHYDMDGESDFFLLMRAWRDAERNGFHPERCQRIGVHAQAARQIGPLFEQFLRIAREEGFDISEKAVAGRCSAALFGFRSVGAARTANRCAATWQPARRAGARSVTRVIVVRRLEVREIESGGGWESAI
jgi:ATP-dependent helicase HrpB